VEVANGTRHRVQVAGHEAKDVITPASKHLKDCHAGLDPASSLFNGFQLACSYRVFAGMTEI
jgi:hypothetical protein